jgi:probable rRNA maturation factor
MSRLPINFFSEEFSFTLKQKTLVRNWINKTILAEGYRLGELNFIFSGDEYVLKINRDYLNHDTYTDIITFDNSEEEKLIVSDIFISIERIRENSKKFNVSERDELHRVMIHGTLHLLGYPDKGKEAKKVMTAKEDHYLSLRNF